ncbi:MAG: ATP-dependent endonuclease [Gammaproteobacteria bacterium]|nr:ATP-dependent endonuclease [Gammaproteobacteria bacterium]
MKIKNIAVRNFRRLESVQIGIEESETIFVGANNSGKTSATAAFRCFVDGKDFKVFDFSVARITDIDQFGSRVVESLMPAIELDIWFSIDINSIAFGRAFSLLPQLSEDFSSVGIRLRYENREHEAMLAEYETAYPINANGLRKRTLSQFLAIDGNLKRYYQITYHSIDSREEDVILTQLETNEGKRLLGELVRIDFVDAQRYIDDEDVSRGNRLSAAFATFYKKNLEQAEVSESAHAVIDDNNQKLTEHYRTTFQGIFDVIRGLGIPSVNDRDLRLVSSLSPEVALTGNTELFYVDAVRAHELPETYNGLGFKNLIYMAIQISHFHLQWMHTEKNRPLCQLIFIEEPEVHLHAQVQQVFISNIWKIVCNAAGEAGQESLIPQLIVTTHSSHILDAVDFPKIRYFRRCLIAGEERVDAQVLNASEVHSLRDFRPDAIGNVGDADYISEAEALQFLTKYLKLTHCDLFFADAAILVEGTVEKLLLPRMIERAAPGLRNKYLTILEVGGAYAHRFLGLMHFLNIPHLIITDLDSVEAGGTREVCIANAPGALTANGTLKAIFNLRDVAALSLLRFEQKVNVDEVRCVVFQTESNVEDEGSNMAMKARTLEEAFVFDNFPIFRNSHIKLGVTLPNDLQEAYECIHKRIKSSAFKKTEFALDILSSTDEWNTPSYIAEGLIWLESTLNRVAPVIAVPEA